MSKKLKLTKIELETKNGKKVELSIDEARELHSQLDELFGKGYVPSQPVIIERERPFRYYPPYYWQWTSKTIANDPNAGSSNTYVLDAKSNNGLYVSYTADEVNHV